MNKDVKDRVEEELRKIANGQFQAALFENPDAVIYNSLPSSLGVVNSTDVLVVVPAGYPGAMLDHAYLLAGSPLIGIVKGQPEQVILEVNDRRWQRVSYHPHSGGGAPPWNPTVHGFHTYIDEVLSWVSIRR